MSTRRKRLLRRLTSVGLVTALLYCSVAAPALAQTTDEVAVPASAVSVGGVLHGSLAGSFAAYRIAYPGGDEEVSVRVAFEPYDPSYANAMGMILYGPNGYEAQGTWSNDDGALVVAYGGDASASLLVQLFNYTDRTVSYTLWAGDLALVGVAPADVVVTEAPAAVATEDLTEAEPVDVDTPADETVTDELAGPVVVDEATGAGLSGTVVGSRAGAFGQHALRLVPDESLTVILTFWPADPSFAGAFGLDIYDPEGGFIAAGEATDVFGRLEATFESDLTGEYLMVVYNYAEDVTMGYSLTLQR